MVNNPAGIALILLATLITLPARAADETNRELARTFAAFHFDRNEFGKAARFLTDHLTQDNADAGGWNMLGVIYVKWGHLKHASDCFGRASRVPGSDARGVYLYNYADALARQGDVATAKTALIEARRSDSRLGDDVKYALANLRAGQPLPEATSVAQSSSTWRLSMGLSSGYDSNVLLISDSNISSAVATGAASPFVTPSVQFQGVTSLDKSAIYSNAYSNFAYQTKPDAQIFNGLYSGAGAEWGDPEDTVARFSHYAGLQTDLAFVNTNGFRFFSTGGAATWRMVSRHSSKHESELQLPLVYTRYGKDDGDLPANDRTGFGVRPTATYTRRLGVNQASIAVSYEKTLAKGTNFRANTYAGSVNFIRPIGMGIRARVGVDGTWLTYYSSETGRLDKTGRASLSFSRAFGKGLIGALDYGFRRNTSNVVIARYSKHTLGVMVTYEVF